MLAEQLAQIKKALDELQESIKSVLDDVSVLKEQNALRENVERLEGFEESFQHAEDVSEKARRRSAAGDDSRRRSSIGTRSFAQLLHEELAGGVNLEGVEDAETEKMYREKTKSVAMTATEHGGEQELHEDFMDDLETAFQLNGMSQIVDEDEEAWVAFASDENNRAKVVYMSKVMIATLQAKARKGTVVSAYKDFKRGNKQDARGMYLAVKFAYHKTSSRLTKQSLKRRLEKIEMPSPLTLEKLTAFWHKCTVVINLLSGVKDTKTGEVRPLDDEEKVELMQKKFTDPQLEMSKGDRTWQKRFDRQDDLYAETGTGWTLDSLKTIIEREVGDDDAAEGAVHAQTMTGSRNCYTCGGAGHYSSGCPKRTCHKCGETGHLMKDCPQKAEGAKAEGTKDKLSQYNKARDEQFKMFEQWSKLQETQQGKNTSQQGKSNAQQSSSYDSDDDVPWHVGLERYVLEQERAEAEAAKSKGKKKGNCKAQRLAADENREAERSKAAEAKGPPQEWDDNMQEKIALAQFDLNNMKLKDPEGEYELIDFLQ